MKRFVLLFALVFTLTIGTSFAKSSATLETSCFFQERISNETALRVLKLASEEVSYSYGTLVEMRSIGQVTISEMSDPNVYLVAIQEADGGTVEVIILDTL